VMLRSTAMRSATGDANSTRTGCATPTTSPGPGRIMVMALPSRTDPAAPEPMAGVTPTSTAVVMASNQNRRTVLYKKALPSPRCVLKFYVRTTYYERMPMIGAPTTELVPAGGAE
jgi:hypothetical protein